MESFEIFKLYSGKKCQACGGFKSRSSAFCPPCYHQLPRALKSSLWKRFGQGFEEAYHAALSWFREYPYQGAHRVTQAELFDRSAPDRAGKGGKKS